MNVNNVKNYIIYAKAKKDATFPEKKEITPETAINPLY